MPQRNVRAPRDRNAIHSFLSDAELQRRLRRLVRPLVRLLFQSGPPARPKRRRKKCKSK